MRSLKTVVGSIGTAAAFIASVATIASYFGVVPKFNDSSLAEKSAQYATTDTIEKTKAAAADRLSNGATSKETHLKIQRVDIYPFENYSSIKIRANINGIEYKFPSNGNDNWLTPSSDIFEQNANLAPSSKYSIKFEVTKRNARSGNEIKLLSNETIFYYGLPTSGQYSLRGFDPESSEKSGVSTALIKYSIGPTD